MVLHTLTTSVSDEYLNSSFANTDKHLSTRKTLLRGVNSCQICLSLLDNIWILSWYSLSHTLYLPFSLSLSLYAYLYPSPSLSLSQSISFYICLCCPLRMCLCANSYENLPYHALDQYECPPFDYLYSAIGAQLTFVNTSKSAVYNVVLGVTVTERSLTTLYITDIEFHM